MTNCKIAKNCKREEKNEKECETIRRFIAEEKKMMSFFLDEMMSLLKLAKPISYTSLNSSGSSTRLIKMQRGANLVAFNTLNILSTKYSGRYY